jgi:hypothetical protein
MNNKEYRIQNIEYRIQNSKCKMQNAKYNKPEERIEDSGLIMTYEIGC